MRTLDLASMTQLKNEVLNSKDRVRQIAMDPKAADLANQQEADHILTLVPLKVEAAAGRGESSAQIHKVTKYGELLCRDDGMGPLFPAAGSVSDRIEKGCRDLGLTVHFMYEHVGRDSWYMLHVSGW